jgi:hypothetical protein
MCETDGSRPPRRELRAGEARIEDLDLDRFAHLTLALLRSYCQTFAAPPSQGWLQAIEIATRHAGSDRAPSLCYDLLAVIQALRSSRRSVFTFSNPDCPCCRPIVAAEERQLLAMLEALRRGHRGQAATHALLVCEGQSAERLLEAASRYLQRHDLPKEQADSLRDPWMAATADRAGCWRT